MAAGRYGVEVRMNLTRENAGGDTNVPSALPEFKGTLEVKPHATSVCKLTAVKPGIIERK